MDVAAITAWGTGSDPSVFSPETGCQDKVSAFSFFLPVRYSMVRSNSCKAIPHLASFPEGCGVFSKDFKAS